MRVLVYGLGKTGTTAMADGILASLPGHAMVFEPKSLAAVDLASSDVVVKSVRANAWRADQNRFALYDKRILVVRHPFDRLVSYLLYDPYNGHGFSNDETANRYAELLVRKCEAPESVSVRQISDVLTSITGRDAAELASAQCRTLIPLDRDLGESFHRLSYEDFVDGRRDALEAYLGFSLPEVIEVRPGVERVVRTKAHGDYHRWFTPQDVEWLRPLLTPYAKRFGYSLELDPSVDRTLEPSIAHGYVERIINDYRARHGLPRFVLGKVTMRQEGTLFDRSLELFRAGEFAEAEELLVQATELAPRNAGVALRLAIVRMRLGNYDQAHDSAKAAEELDPTTPGLTDLLRRIATHRRHARAGR